MTASYQKDQEGIDKGRKELAELVAESERLWKNGSLAAAEKKQEEALKKGAENIAFIEASRAQLKTVHRPKADKLRSEIVAEVVEAGRARGATVVLDMAFPPHTVQERVGQVEKARVRTVDLNKLYRHHPETRRLERRILEEKSTPEQASERRRAHRVEMWPRLFELARTVAVRAGANFVVDSSGVGSHGVPYVAYSALKLDITAEVGRELRMNLPPLAGAIIQPEEGGTRMAAGTHPSLYESAEHVAKAVAEGDAALLGEMRAKLKKSARLVGAELVWDQSGKGHLGFSPVLFAHYTLSLLVPSPARVLTVDMTALLQRHPKMSAHREEMEALAKKGAAEIHRRANAIAGMEAEYDRLVARGDAAGAARWREKAETELNEIKAYGDKKMAELEKVKADFRQGLLRQLAREAVDAAEARGATLVLDRSSFSTEGISPFLFVAKELRPAEDGGVRDAPVAPVAHVRTVDLQRLIDRHPKIGAQTAQLIEQVRQGEGEFVRLREAIAALVREVSRLEQAGDKAGASKAFKQLKAAHDDLAALEKAGEDEILDRVVELRTTIAEEIARKAGELARQSGGNLVIDTSAPSDAGLEFVAYAAPKLDLTEAVARELGIVLKE